jgi:nicotinate-nucleotide--dimethylbenzimidazole phosphoribosyltransferase
MSRQPRTVLVLGGIRSGKSEYAESLLSDATSVRYVATATDSGSDADWSARLAAHRDRRPNHWSTEEIGKTPDDLPTMISSAPADDTILVDDIGAWLTVLLERAAGEESETTAQSARTITTAVEALTTAVGTCAARVVFVSPEVGLSIIPATPLGRTFADACGSVNRALAEACDGVALVVAGQPTWLKATAARLPENLVVTPAMPTKTRTPVPVTSFDLDVADEETPITLGMSLPLPDTAATTEALERLAALPLPGAGLGAIAAAVEFAAAAQSNATPRPFRSIRVIQVHGVQRGEIATGDDAARWADRIMATRLGESPLAMLAAEVSASVEIIDSGEAAAIEDGPAATAEEIETALRRGWAAANAAADRGDDLIVLAASGPGVDAAAAALVGAVTMSEIPALIGRVWGDAGRIDDEAWMRRCITIRDAMLRLRGVNGMAADAPSALAAVGGPALATATGLILGAASRRTPVLLDGPVGAAAALVARDYAAQTRMWCLLTDHGNQPTVRTAADMLGLTPLVELHLGLGEGCNALAVLPLIQSALAISASLSVPPPADVLSAVEPGEAEPIEDLAP